MTIKRYLVSLPERMVRSALGLGAGVAREIGEVVLPKSVRGSHLYKNIVDTTLRFLIEKIGGVEGIYPDADTLANDFLTRRTAGNVIEALGIVSFRASPVWVLAALADVCGIGRQLIPEIADALKTQGLLDPDVQYASVDQVLDGLERTSARLAAAINTPPLDVPSLRAEWAAIREEARSLRPGGLPSGDAIRDIWRQLKAESVRQERSVFETSSMLALGAVQRLPAGIRWFSRSAKLGAGRTGKVFATAMLDHYTQTLLEIRRVGYAAYAVRQLRPYTRAAMQQFSPCRETITERMMSKRIERKEKGKLIWDKAKLR